ncbi:unnamed protein product, partial [Rotaria socialis]
MTSSPVYQCKRALIIGINTYQNNSLNYCINDAKDLMTTLNRIGFKEVLLGVDCKRTKFLQMVETFAGRIKPTDLTLFYFSGHGKQYENENYLLPSDYDYDYSTRESIYLLDNAVSVQYIMKKIYHRYCPVTIFIFDCCRTNVRTKGGSDQQGLSPMHASPETLIAYACAPGAVAVDETRNGRNGYFAEHLLKHIATPNNDIEDILKIVAREVKLQTSGFQVPFRTSSLTEKVCLVTSNVQAQMATPAPVGSDNNMNNFEVISSDEAESEPLNDDETRNEQQDAGVSRISIATGSAISSGSWIRCSITLYMLRKADPNHKWQIQAVFGNKRRLAFNSAEALSYHEASTNKNEAVPILYRLQLIFIYNDKRQVCVCDDGKYYITSSFKIRISEPGITFTSHYYAHSLHALMISPSMSDQFLFGIHFKKGGITSLNAAPPGISISLWDSLPIFAYYLLRTQSYDKCGALFDQFKIIEESSGLIMSSDCLEKFLSMCLKYLPTIGNVLNQDLNALKILIQMIALIPISKRNIVFDTKASEFVSVILKIFSNKLDAIIVTINKNDWISFYKGLTVLICIKIRHEKDKNDTDNTIDLLSRISEKEQREDAALQLLKLFKLLERRLPGNKMMELYKLVNPKDLSLEYLAPSASWETYIYGLTRIVENCEYRMNDLEDHIKDQLRRFLNANYFPMLLPDVAWILTYLKRQTNSKSTQIIQRIFQKSDPLQISIEQYLDSRRYSITSHEFPLVRDILIRSYNSELMHNINRQEYLLRMLTYRKEHKTDHFIEWFKCFLCETDENWIRYQDLVYHWTNCFVKDQIALFEIMKEVDLLIDLWIKVAPNNNQRSDFFVAHMVTQCFSQENVNNLLKNALHTVNNEKFLEAFKKQYEKEKLADAKGQLRNLKDPTNPLFQLINIAEEQKRQNKIVEDLIILAESMIEVGDSELLNDTFNNPSRGTFVYLILFDKSLSSLSIHKNIVNRLSQQWTKWEQGTLLASDIRTWENFPKEQKAIFHEIWPLVAKETEKTVDIDSVFDVSCKALKAKLETNDKIITCLDTYCQDAIDKSTYDDLVKNWHERFEIESIHLIDIPPALSNIVEFADELNPYAASIAWKTYLDRQTAPSRNNRSLERNPIARQLSEELDNDTTSRQEEEFSTDIIQESINNKVKMESIAILKEATEILKQFKQILQHTCEQGRRIPIENILRLFPDINQAQNDL